MLHGMVLYRDLYDLKPPGIYFLDALIFRVAGPDAVNLYVAAALAGALTAAAVYSIASDLWGRPTALLSGLLFAFFSPSVFIQGGGLNTEVWMIVPLTWSLYFLCRAVNTGSLRDVAAAGLLIGLASLFKQVAAVALLAGACGVYWHVRGSAPERHRSSALAAALLGGFLFPWVVTGAYFSHVGALREFLFWVIEYPFSYMAFSQRVIDWATVGRRLGWNLNGLMMLWLFSVAALAAAVIQRPGRKEKVLWMFYVSSGVGVIAGWNFFPHYFIQMVPALSLLAARGIVALYEFSLRTKSKVGGAVLLVALVVSGGVFTLNHHAVYTRYSGEDISIKEASPGFFGFPAFALGRSVGLDLMNLTGPRDKVFVWKDHAEISFYALRETPTRMPIAALPFTPVEGIVVEDLEKGKPEFIVVFNPVAVFNFEPFMEILRKEYVKILNIHGLSFAEQGIYRRKTP
jgi:hypothetical protein